ncbi:MAG: XRE family transcriptional regulator [Oscillospiraceae bacterium]
MEFNEIIKAIRAELRLLQEGFARELHVGFTSVNRWKNCKSKPNQLARHANTLCNIANKSKHRYVRFWQSPM